MNRKHRNVQFGTLSGPITQLLIQFEHISGKTNSLILLKDIDGNSNVESFIYRNKGTKKM